MLKATWLDTLVLNFFFLIHQTLMHKNIWFLCNGRSFFFKETVSIGQLIQQSWIELMSQFSFYNTVKSEYLIKNICHFIQVSQII